jgi:hypothetical protein
MKLCSMRFRVQIPSIFPCLGKDIRMSPRGYSGSGWNQPMLGKYETDLVVNSASHKKNPNLWPIDFWSNFIALDNKSVGLWIQNYYQSFSNFLGH